MQIAKAVKRGLLVASGCMLLSSVTWGQAWGPRVVVEFGAPVRFTRVAPWYPERAWRERERREEWRRCHRRREWREEQRENYRRY